MHPVNISHSATFVPATISVDKNTDNF